MLSCNHFAQKYLIKRAAVAIFLAFPIGVQAVDVLSTISLSSANTTLNTFYASDPTLGNAVYVSTTPQQATTYLSGVTSSSTQGGLATNPYKYATVAFPVSTAGTYTFGQSSAPVDTTLYVYHGAFNPANLAQNFVTGNDDYQSGIAPLASIPSGLTMGTCNSTNQCPIVTSALGSGQTYTLVLSHWGSGDYSSFSLPLGIFVYGPGGVTFVQTGVRVEDSVNAMVNTPALGAARVIDSTPALVALYAGAGLTGDRAISNATTQTLPLLTGNSMIAAQSALSGINRIIQARLEGNRGMSSGDAFYGDKNFWMKPFGSLADQGDRGGVSGFKANTYGMAAGFDGTLSTALRAGVAFAYVKSDINSKSSIAPNSSDVDVYQLIGYGSYSIDQRTEVNFQVDAGQNTNKGKRTIAFTSSIASSDYRSESTHVGIGIARSLQFGTQTTLTPSVRADYTWIRDQAYSEMGAGLLNLDVASRSTEALVVGVDGKLAHQINDQTTLMASLGIGYDTINKQSAITSAFAGAPGAAFVTYGIDPSPWIASSGIGLAYKTKSGVEITGRYDAEYRESFLIQTASVKARWAF